MPGCVIPAVVHAGSGGGGGVVANNGNTNTNVNTNTNTNINSGNVFINTGSCNGPNACSVQRVRQISPSLLAMLTENLLAWQTCCSMAASILCSAYCLLCCDDLLLCNASPL